MIKEAITELYLATHPKRIRQTFSQLVDSDLHKSVIGSGINTGDINTDFYCVYTDTIPLACMTCGKFLHIAAHSSGYAVNARYCSRACLHKSSVSNSSTTLFTEYDKLLDVNGNLSRPKQSKYLNAVSIQHLKTTTGIDTDDIATLLSVVMGYTAPKYCRTCGKVLHVHNIFTGYRDNQNSCSYECKDADPEYRKNLSSKRLGISKFTSQKHVYDVATPWFESRVAKSLDAGYKPLFDLNEYGDMGRRKTLRFECVRCTTQFSSSNWIKRCRVCFPNSSEQEQVRQFVSNYVCGISVNDRTIIPPKEIDIYINAKKLAIEYDGLYWHQDKDDYDKFVSTNELGIRLLKIYDIEWLNKRSIVESRIKSVLGVIDKRIYARNCIVRELEVGHAKAFLNENHIQGYANSKIKLGLYHDDVLVAAMTFGTPRYNNNYEYELIRFASILDTVVVGGASKLFSHFVKTFNPKSILSYCDLRYGIGGVYEKLGFVKSHRTQPNFYLYDGKKLYSRIEFQKHKLKDRLSNYDDTIGTDENLTNAGYSKIYDFGNDVYTWCS